MLGFTPPMCGRYRIWAPAHLAFWGLLGVTGDYEGFSILFCTPMPWTSCGDPICPIAFGVFAQD